MPTRRALGALLSATALAPFGPARPCLAQPFLARPAPAQAAFPSRPVRLVVGFTPGGATDIAARLIAPRMGELLGQPLVIDNRPGAGGNIATEAVIRAPADGHTLLLGTLGPLVVNPVLEPELGFRPLEDLAAVASLVQAFGVLVVPAASPWRSLAELLAAARAAPETLSWGHSGLGTSGHLAGALLDRLAGIRTITVPYRGGGPLMNDLLAGRLGYAFSTAATALPQVAEGRARALAVPTPQRAPQLPDVPTVAEAGVAGFDCGSPYGLMAPANTPAAWLQRLSEAARVALADPQVAALLHQQGLGPQWAGPAEFGAQLRAEAERWAPMIRASGLGAAR